MENKDISIKEAVSLYIDEIEMSHSSNTVKTYKNAVSLFLNSVEQRGISPESNVSEIDQSCFIAFAKSLKNYSPSTEILYVTALKKFFSFLSDSGFSSFNSEKIKKILKNKMRPAEKKAPSFSVDAIEKVIKYASELPDIESKTTREELIQRRDAAFIILLADSGMRVNEACALRIRDVDMYKRKASVIGIKGETEIVRLSGRSISFIDLYLKRRMEEVGTDGKVYAALPVFAAHDKKSGSQLKPITTKTGREIVKQCVRAAAGPGAVGSITPSSFRHYFISKVLEKTGDMELTRKITRTVAPVIIKKYSQYDSEAADNEYDRLFD